MVTHTRLIITVLVVVSIPALVSAQWVEIEPPTYGAEFEQLVEAADGTLIAVTKWATYRRASPGDAWVPVDGSVHVRDIVVHRTGTLFGCAWDGQDLLRSTNHGVTWEMVQSYLQTCTFLLSSQSGSIFVAPSVPQGSAQELYRSDDQGLSWIALPGAPSLTGRSNTVTVGDSVLLAAAKGTIYRSDDLGETWSETFGLRAENGARSFAVKGDTVFTLGISWNPPHDVIRSVDAGLTWTKVGETTARNASLCAALGPSGEVFVDGTERRLSSSRDGITWQPVEPEIRDVCPELLIHSSGTMFARQASRNVMALEPDGNEWSDASAPINEKPVKLTAGSDDFLYATWRTAGKLEEAYLPPETSHWTRIMNPRPIATIDTEGALYAIDDDVVYRSRSVSICRSRHPFGWSSSMLWAASLSRWPMAGGRRVDTE